MFVLFRMDISDFEKNKTKQNKKTKTKKKTTKKTTKQQQQKTKKYHANSLIGARKVRNVNFVRVTLKRVIPFRLFGCLSY